MSSLETAVEKLTTLVTQLATLQAQSVSRQSVARFSFPEHKAPEAVDEYLKRFKLQLQLSAVPKENECDYLRVHMGSELNIALKSLAYPKQVEALTFAEAEKFLVDHFVKARNKYSEAIKFRRIVQEQTESITAFVAAACDDIRNEIVSRKPEKFEEAVKIAMERESTHEASTIAKTTENSSQHSFTRESRPRLKRSLRSRSFSRHRSNSSQRSNSTSSRRVYSSARQPSPGGAQKPAKPCYGCGDFHWRVECPYRNKQCPKCSRFNHSPQYCRNSSYGNNNSRSRAHYIASEEAAPLPSHTYDPGNFSSDFLQNSIVSVHSVNRQIIPRILIDVAIEGIPLKMELDSGGSCSFVSKETFTKFSTNSEIRILPTDLTFTSYTQHKFQCVGYALVNVSYRGRTLKLKLFIADFPAESIFGRQWIAHFADLLPSFQELCSSKQNSISNPQNSPTPSSTSENQQLKDLLTKYDHLFSDSAGTLVGPPVELHLRPDATPKFARARPIPFALIGPYAAEIDKKINSGLYKKVTHSEWASPTHVVVKNGKIRITGDYKSTLNPQLIVDEHPIPRIEELFHRIRHAKFFAKIDVTDAFMTLVCTDKACEVMTLNTPTHGLIRPTRAQYGVSSIPAIWQRRLEEVLRGLDSSLNFYDDILVFSTSSAGLLRALGEVFARLDKSGIKLKKTKCAFLLQSVEYLGHRIDGNGLHKLDTHVRDLLQAKRPENFDELRTFIGKVNFYHAFMPNLSAATFPLREMLKAPQFKWTPSGLNAFKALREELASDRVLMPYSPDLPLILAVDASPVGLGAVLSHVLPNNVERPISYASKALSPAEKSYSQVDREGLSVVWGVKRFFQFLYGREFTIYTDNKAVSHIFAPDALLPKFTLSRLANYANYLAQFQYKIKHRPGSQNANADYLSRSIPQSVIEFSVNALRVADGNAEFEEEGLHDEFDQFMFDQVSQLPVSHEDIAAETLKDPTLSPILHALREGKDLRAMG
ncbi:unnamed protein product, partial [Nesidiocoris tenuis]